MSHPISTAYDGTFDRYTRTETGERLYANLRNYGIEGKRVIHWVVDEYELYHRTISTLINDIVSAGFIIEECQESKNLAYRQESSSTSCMDSFFPFSSHRTIKIPESTGQRTAPAPAWSRPYRHRLPRKNRYRQKTLKAARPDFPILLYGCSAPHTSGEIPHRS